MWKRQCLDSAKYNCGNGNYFSSIMVNSAIMSDEVTESYNEKTHVNKNKATCKTQNLHFLY